MEIKQKLYRLATKVENLLEEQPEASSLEIVQQAYKSLRKEGWQRFTRIDWDVLEAIVIVASTIKEKPLVQGTRLQIYGILERYYFHLSNIYDSQMRYRLGANVSTLTSILVAIVVALSILKVPQFIIGVIGLVAIITNKANFFYSFSSNFEDCAKIAIDLRDWSTNFQLELKKVIEDEHVLSNPQSLTTSINKFIEDQDKEISKIGRDCPTLFIPNPLPGLNDIPLLPPKSDKKDDKK
ncbi:MAG: hypothetical protein AB4290_09925 [Spirulina sp.]